MQRSNARPDWSRFYSLSREGLGAMHARFQHHRYPRHAHEYLVLGYIPSGAQAYRYRGSQHVTPSGAAFIVNPEEPHTGEPATADMYTMQTLYAQPSVLTRLMSDLGSRPGVPRFSEAIVRNERIVSLLRECHAAIELGAPAIASESLALDVLAALIRAYGLSRGSDRAAHESSSVRTARDYIEERYAEDITLSDLAALVSLNPYYFARAFERQCGLPPHAYVENVRIRHACRLLQSGGNIATVALSVGYSDQPHLTRRFKRFLGVTPAAYKHAFQGLARQR